MTQANPDSAEKVSQTKSIGFRPGSELRTKLEGLKHDTGADFTEILKLGVTAYWPEIDNLVRVGVSKGRCVESPEQLRAWLDACRAAKARGIDPHQVLTSAYETALTAEAAPMAPAA